ncbi:MAG TPA: hypothetical protein V6D15_12255 [Oculatellaceae cyanobacterium]|jgi:uncharacterized membrane protein YqiK
MKKLPLACLPLLKKTLPLAISLLTALEITPASANYINLPSTNLTPISLTQSPNLIAQIPQPDNSQEPTESDNWSPILIAIPFIVIGGFVFAHQMGFIFGLVVISSEEVGIVIKKFARRSLSAGRLIALNNEAGLQADTLAPGWHWGYWPWQYNVRREPVVIIPQGEIGLVVARDGASLPPERILGKVVACDNFQDARKFFTKGGEKGRQLGILTAGTYRINTGVFTVITSDNAPQLGMQPQELKLYAVKPNQVGIVITLDGLPIQEGEIASSTFGGDHAARAAGL